MKYTRMTLGIALLLLLVLPKVEEGLPLYFDLDNYLLLRKSSEPFFLLDDVNFAFRPEIFDFDIQAFLKEQSSPLVDYRGPMFSSEEDASEMLRLVAHYYGINPKVLLAAIEVQARLVSQPSLDKLENWVLGYHLHSGEVQDGLCPGDGGSLFSQFILLARRLNEGYFNWRDSQEGARGTYSVLTFADGSQHTVPMGINAATFAILYALAEVNPQERWQELVTDAPQGFRNIYITLFDQDPLQPTDVRIHADPYPNTIQFPWPNGQSWCYSQGPHVGETVSNALDFAPPGNSGCLNSKCLGNWIVAADSGTVVDTSPLWVKIDFGNGWMTGYFHTPDEDKIITGKACRGEPIGHPGCCGNDGCTYCMPCGSSCPGCCASGTHTHFTLYKDGSPETWVGKTLSGWTIQSNGCLAKEGQIICPNYNCPGSSFITSDVSKDCCCCSNRIAQAKFQTTLQETTMAIQEETLGPIFPGAVFTPPSPPTLLPLSFSTAAPTITAIEIENNLSIVSGAKRSVVGSPQLFGEILSRRLEQLRTSSGFQHAPVGHRSSFAPETSIVEIASHIAYIAPFLVDTNAPVLHVQAAEETGWSRVANLPVFTWEPAIDNESGLKGYLVYWGDNPFGTANILVTQPFYLPPANFRVTDVAVRYLRVAPIDHANNQGVWQTIKIWKYDGTAPTMTLGIGNGGGTTRTLNTTLYILGEDTGSGIASMRFSIDGVNWTDWEPYVPWHKWTLDNEPGAQVVYAQVQDNAGNESIVSRATIIANLNVLQPSSTSYQLVRSVVAMGGGFKNSASYQTRSTSGQTSGVGQLVSAKYVVNSGFWSSIISPSQTHSIYLPLIQRLYAAP